MSVYVKQVNRLKRNSMVKLKQNCWWQSRKCNRQILASQVTKIVWVDNSAEPIVAHWDGEMANKSWKRNMLRHVKTQ